MIFSLGIKKEHWEEKDLRIKSTNIWFQYPKMYIVIIYIKKCKNVYSDIVNEYKNTYPRTIKMMPVDIKSSTYIDFNKENIKKDPKFEVGHHVRILKCKISFVKGYI